MNQQTLLANALHTHHLSLDTHQQSALITYLSLLNQWNQVYNLTSIRDPKEQIYLHLIDSLLISPYLSGQQILDVGTGAGLPGIPLAIMHPEKSFTLLDKNAKKTRFLIQVIAELDLKNVTIVQSDLTQFQPSSYFDSIVSRAFGTIKLFLTLTASFLNAGGQLLAMKGRYPQEELEALAARHTLVDMRAFHPAAVHPLTLKGMAVERHVVVLKKI